MIAYLLFSVLLFTVGIALFKVSPLYWTAEDVAQLFMFCLIWPLVLGVWLLVGAYWVFGMSWSSLVVWINKGKSNG